MGRSRVLFVRHAESLANAGGITMPNNLIPLSEAGARAARALAATLPAPPALVLVSRALRTQQTAQPYCRLTGVVPDVEPLLDELSIICPSLIEGMNGVQRREVVRPLWERPDLHRRAGPQADTFIEFQERVRRFADRRLPQLPDGTVIFGHGIWCGMLQWLSAGNWARDAADMLAFRRYQLGLRMANGAAVAL